MLAWRAAVLDLICILVFAILGRRSHAEATDLAGIVRTAWPFLVGCGLGWLASRAWRRPAALPTGIWVWLAAVVGGLALRLASGATAQWPFVIVAAVTLGVLLVGWRAGYRRIGAARRRSATPAGTEVS